MYLNFIWRFLFLFLFLFVLLCFWFVSFEGIFIPNLKLTNNYIHNDKSDSCILYFKSINPYKKILPLILEHFTLYKLLFCCWYCWFSSNCKQQQKKERQNNFSTDYQPTHCRLKHQQRKKKCSWLWHSSLSLSLSYIKTATKNKDIPWIKQYAFM